jgi:hypothetical protein
LDSPVTVTVVELPEQKDVDEILPPEGLATSITVWLTEAEHPLPLSVATTVYTYVPPEGGVEVTGVPVLALRPVEGDHA